jgi:hypothetical protein
MIYVVEFPEQGKAHAWFAFEQQDLLRKIYATDTRKEWEIFDVVTARELLELLGKTADTPDARDEFPAICSLADQHGWDTPLYRADYLLGEGAFQPEVVSETDACIAALTRRTQACKIYWSDTQATAALENDPIFDSEAGSRGREALRDQLVALEILEGTQ